MDLSAVMGAVLILLVPAALHLGMLGPAPVRPRQLENRLESWLFDHLWQLVALNGLLFASSFVLYHAKMEPFWVALLILALPLFAAQISCAVVAKARWASGK